VSDNYIEQLKAARDLVEAYDQHIEIRRGFREKLIDPQEEIASFNRMREARHRLYAVCWTHRAGRDGTAD
jgi:hypothetical protein